MVPISARCTDALAAAGFAPIASSKVVDVTPYAIPSEPSTSCAAKPTSASRTSVVDTAILPHNSDWTNREYTGRMCRPRKHWKSVAERTRLLPGGGIIDQRLH